MRQPASAAPPQRVTVGRITTVYGIKGWVKVHAYTEQRQTIFDYQPWYLTGLGEDRPIIIDGGRPHGKGLIAHLQGVDTPEDARFYCQRDIRVDVAQLPALPPGEYYWHQLQGLRVISHYGDRDTDLGRVQRLFATGSNDVLVVRGDRDSVDRNERLIPYLPGQFITAVDLENGAIRVDWDPEF